MGRTKVSYGKTMMQASELLWSSKRHVSGLNVLNNEEINPAASAIIKLYCLSDRFHGRVLHWSAAQSHCWENNMIGRQLVKKICLRALCTAWILHPASSFCVWLEGKSSIRPTFKLICIHMYLQCVHVHMHCVCMCALVCVSTFLS